MTRGLFKEVILGSLYLNGLNRENRDLLERQLWDQQFGKCFIAGKPITIGFDAVDIDHIVPLRDNGKDDPSNFALTLSHFNRSKQAADLRVARVLARFEEIQETADSDDRGANLNDILRAFGGASSSLAVTVSGHSVTYIASGVNRVTVPLFTDKLSGTPYFFAQLPIAVLYHDDKINPRAIGANVRGLVEEFHRGRPQLHAALAWMQTNDTSRSTIHVFDGQHKAAAQILLGVQALPVRVFVDPDFEVLLTANTNAGTTLRQVAFDKSVQRRLGSVMLRDRIARYRKEKGYAEDFADFSERDLVEFYRGEQRQITRYVLDGVRDAITFSPENGLRDFIEAAGKGTEKPFSYSTIEKTLYSKFISQKMLSTPMNYRQEQGENPRDVEISQIVKLMTTIADKLYVGKFDEDLGTRRIESLVQKGEIVPEAHLRAFRVAKEEVFYCWIGYVGKIVENHFLTNGRAIDAERLFQYVFPPALWANIENFIVNLSQMPMWVNREASATVFGGKQTYSFWQRVFETGTSPSGQKLMPSGMDIMRMIAPR